MIGMVRILAGVSPGNMHFTCAEIDHHGRDSTLTIERVDPGDIVITDRIRQVDMILLDRLQGFDGMGRILSEQTIGTEIAYPRRDQFFRIILDLFHDLRKIMIGVHHISICAMQNVESARRYFHRIQFSALVGQQMVIAGSAMRDQHSSNGARNAFRRQHRAETTSRGIPIRESFG